MAKGYEFTINKNKFLRVLSGSYDPEYNTSDVGPHWCCCDLIGANPQWSAFPEERKMLEMRPGDRQSPTIDDCTRHKVRTTPKKRLGSFLTTLICEYSVENMFCSETP